MELPNDLRLAIERYLRDIPGANLSRAAADLSARYRAGHGRGAQNYLRSAEDVAAYVALRMPATFAAVYHVARALAAASPTLAPRSLLDLGGGSGAALWACAAVWPALATATVIEREEAMIDAGRRIAANARQPAVNSATWQRGDLRSHNTFSADLISLAYVLGEFDPPDRAQLIAQLAASGKILLIVEPGTPAGFAIIRAVREQLIAAGALIAAPCPHQNACPMPAGDWCHMAQRVARIPIQRRTKGAELGYEDEKFSYVAAIHTAPAAIAGRVVRRPEARSGVITLHLCTADGLRREQISRSDPRWRQARDARWGDALTEA